MKEMWLRFMPKEGTTAPCLIAPGRSGGNEDVRLQELLNGGEKHVGRFPERHVPGGGYHDVPC